MPGLRRAFSFVIPGERSEGKEPSSTARVSGSPSLASASLRLAGDDMYVLHYSRGLTARVVLVRSARSLRTEGSAGRVGPRERWHRAMEGTGRAGPPYGGSDAPRAAAFWLLAPRFGAQASEPKDSEASALSVYTRPRHRCRDGRGRRQGRTARPDRAATCEAENPETPPCEGGLGAASRPASRRLRKRPSLDRT
jgi:hypothetical protein